MLINTKMQSFFKNNCNSFYNINIYFYILNNCVITRNNTFIFRSAKHIILHGVGHTPMLT